MYTYHALTYFLRINKKVLLYVNINIYILYKVLLTMTP